MLSCKRARFHGLCLALIALLVASPALALRGNLPDFTPLVKENSAAVVNISTTRKTKPGSAALPGLEMVPELPPDHPLREFLDRFRGGPEAPPGAFDAQSLGSGFVISADGFILTNYHVVRNADEVVVRLSDRREFVASVVGHDERSDLALIRIEANDLPVVKIGKSSELEVGEWVLAIGSPFGFEHSATAGIVSALGRSLPRENYVPFIQTDVAINPGNSGGPLFNLDGEVVGINSQIYSRTGGFMGLSFAIPIELAMDVANQLKESGRVSRGWLGVLIQDVTRDLAESFGMSKPTGALVAQVVPDSPAAKAGIRVGDVIVEYNGEPVETSSALPPLVGGTKSGETIPVKVIRDGKSRVVRVKVSELPEDAEQAATPAAPAPETGTSSEILGITVEPLTEERRQLLGVEGDGVVVTEVRSGPGREAGLAAGDVITSFNRQEVGKPADLAKALEAAPRGKSVPLLVIREGSPRFVALRVPK
jgi:serine protease Do